MYKILRGRELLKMLFNFYSSLFYFWPIHSYIDFFGKITKYFVRHL